MRTCTEHHRLVLLLADRARSLSLSVSLSLSLARTSTLQPPLCPSLRATTKKRQDDRRRRGGNSEGNTSGTWTNDERDGQLADRQENRCRRGQEGGGGGGEGTEEREGGRHTHLL